MIKWKEKADMNGIIKRFMKVPGRMIVCTAKAYLNGPMGGYISEIIKMD